MYMYATEISVTGMKIFPCEHSSPGIKTGTEIFLEKILSLSQHSGQSGIIFVLYVFPLLALLVLVKLQESTKQRQPRTIQVYEFEF